MDIEALQFGTDGFQPFTKTHTSGTIESQSRPIINQRTKLQKLAKPMGEHSMLRNQAIDEAAPVPGRRVTEITGRDIQEKMFLRGMLRQATRENDVIATQPLSFTVPRATADSSQLVLPGSDSSLTPRPVIISTGSNPVTELAAIRSEFPQKQVPTPKSGIN